MATKNVASRPLKNPPKEIGVTLLSEYKNKTVEDFCPQSKHAGRFHVGDTDNHCAHFVSHVLGFRYGELCLSEKWYRDDGRTMRVDEIFHFCPERGLWINKPASLDPCLIFATIESNVFYSDDGSVEFGTHRRKHVGIWIKGSAYNYHNGGTGGPERVAENGAAFFLSLYGPNTVCYFGSFPS